MCGASLRSDRSTSNPLPCASLMSSSTASGCAARIACSASCAVPAMPIVSMPLIEASKAAMRSRTGSESSTRNTRYMADSLRGRAPRHYRRGIKGGVGGRRGLVGIVRRPPAGKWTPGTSGLVVRKPVLDRVPDKLGGAADIQLLQDAGLVRADRLHRQVERVGDVGDGAAGDNPAQHFVLAVGQLLVRRLVLRSPDQLRGRRLADLHAAG